MLTFGQSFNKTMQTFLRPDELEDFSPEGMIGRLWILLPDNSSATAVSEVAFNYLMDRETFNNSDEFTITVNYTLNETVVGASKFFFVPSLVPTRVLTLEIAAAEEPVPDRPEDGRALHHLLHQLDEADRHRHPALHPPHLLQLQSELLNRPSCAVCDVCRSDPISNEGCGLSFGHVLIWVPQFGVGEDDASSTRHFGA